MNIPIEKMPRYPAYKDSGVEWLGEIPEGWSVVPLCSRTKLKSVTNQMDEELLSVYLDKGVIRFSDVESKRTNVTSLDLSKYQLVDNGDFVLNNQQAWRGSVGVSKYKGIVSPAYLVLQLSDDFVPDFANYFFRNGTMVSQYLVCSKGVGTIQRNLYWPQLKRTSIALPPLDEQQAIAGFLDKKTGQIDEAIAIKEQQIELLKERKQIIIQKAVTRGLNPSAPLRDSGIDWIGQIPAHWEVKKIKHLVSFIGGGTPNKERKDYWGGDICWVSPKDMKVKLISNSIDKITELAVKNSSVKMVPPNTVLIVVRGMILARKIPVALTLKPVTINQDMKGLIIKPTCNPYFVLYLLDGLHEELSTILEESGHGTKTMPTGQLASFQLPYPSLEEQSLIIEYIETESKRIVSAIDLQKQQITALKEYKTTLINSAVTGQIRIPTSAEA